MRTNTYKQTYQNHQDSWRGNATIPPAKCQWVALGNHSISLKKSCFKSSSGVCHCYLPCKSPYVQWNSNPNHPTDPSNSWCTNCLSPNSFENPVKQQLSEGIGSIIPNQQRTCHWFFFRPQGICWSLSQQKIDQRWVKMCFRDDVWVRTQKSVGEGIQEIFHVLFFGGVLQVPNKTFVIEELNLGGG